MTEQEALWAGVRQEIARAQAQYQEEQEDSYLSHVRAAEEQTLQALYERLQAGRAERSCWHGCGRSCPGWRNGWSRSWNVLPLIGTTNTTIINAWKGGETLVKPSKSC